jgi:hypothetical protein
MARLNHSHTTLARTLERLLAISLVALALLLVRLTYPMSAESARQFESILSLGLSCLGQPSGVC